MELIRFYLINSEHSSKNIFTGAFQKERLLIDVINTIHETPWLEKGMGRFVYRHGYKKTDALSLGRILFEPDGIALRAAQKVHKQITADRINFSNGWIGFPKTHFPFKQKTKLQLYGKRLLTESGFIFLC